MSNTEIIVGFILYILILVALSFAAAELKHRRTP